MRNVDAFLLKAEDLLRGPTLRTMPGDSATFAPMCLSLAQAGYGVDDLVTLLGLSSPRDFSAMRRHMVPGYVWRCDRSNTSLGDLTRLWMFSQPIAAARAEGVLGADTVALLLRRGLLQKTDEGIRATVDLYPCEGVLVFTDHSLQTRAPLSMQHVYELGADSYALARLTPRSKVERTLDLGTGSGIHAILAAGHSAQVVGVDINPRAVQFARINAGINGVAERCRFLESDLYGGLGDETFDLIVSNPPWVPTPQDGMQLHRTGGESGEIITRRIVEGLPRHLRPGGTMAMFVHYPDMKDTSYIERLTSWLGGATGWGVAVVNCAEMSLDTYISLHQAPQKTLSDRDRDVCRWLESYERMGIERICIGMVYVRRLSEGTAGWSVCKNVNALPSEPMSPYLEPWLDALDHFNDAIDWPSWQPRVKAGRTLWKDSQTGRAVIEFATHGWDGPVELDPAAAELVDRLQSHGVDTDSEVTRDLLRSLGRQNIIH